MCEKVVETYTNEEFKKISEKYKLTYSQKAKAKDGMIYFVQEYGEYTTDSTFVIYVHNDGTVDSTGILFMHKLYEDIDELDFEYTLDEAYRIVMNNLENIKVVSHEETDSFYIFNIVNKDVEPDLISGYSFSIISYKVDKKTGKMEDNNGLPEEFLKYFE